MQPLGRLSFCLLSILFTVSVFGCASEESSEAYPNRPIKVVVPFAAGGGSDTFGRVIKRAIEENDLLPQPLVIVNVGGAGGTIGSRRVLAANPDGYTVLLLHDAILISKYAGKVRYGPEEFAAVAGTAENGTVVVVRDDPHAYQSLDEALTDAAQRPDTLTFGCNLGTPTHFVGLLLESVQPRADFRFVQTGGGAHRFAALQGGHIDLTVFSNEEYLRFRSEGLRALAFLGKQRHPAMPEVPTAIEQGYEVTAGIMQYWWMPKGTPPERIDRFADALEQAMQTDRVQEFLKKSHSEPLVVRGQALENRIQELETQLSAVNLREKVEMPNLPLWTLIGTLVLALVVTVQSWRSGKKSVEQREPESTTHYGLAVTCMLLVAAYAFALTIEVNGAAIGFRSATSVFVTAVGFCISGRRWRFLPWILGLAVVLSFGLHYLFTQVFQVDLP